MEIGMMHTPGPSLMENASASGLVKRSSYLGCCAHHAVSITEGVGGSGGGLNG